jgi:hypothetical protein
LRTNRTVRKRGAGECPRRVASGAREGAHPGGSVERRELAIFSAATLRRPSSSTSRSSGDKAVKWNRLRQATCSAPTAGCIEVRSASVRRSCREPKASAIFRARACRTRTAPKGRKGVARSPPVRSPVGRRIRRRALRTVSTGALATSTAVPVRFASATFRRATVRRRTARRMPIATDSCVRLRASDLPVRRRATPA